jgi:hypothetical protein
MALRLERADTLTIPRWVDVRPVMPWCQELTVVRTPNSRDTLLTAAWEGLASGYDANTVADLADATGIARSRSAPTSRPRLAVRLVRGRQPSRLSRGRRRSRTGWPRFTKRFGYTDVSRRRREKAGEAL